MIGKKKINLELTLDELKTILVWHEACHITAKRNGFCPLGLRFWKEQIDRTLTCADLHARLMRILEEKDRDLFEELKRLKEFRNEKKESCYYIG